MLRWLFVAFHLLAEASTARRLTKALDDMREILDIAKQGKLRIKAF